MTSSRWIRTTASTACPTKTIFQYMWDETLRRLSKRYGRRLSITIELGSVTSILVFELLLQCIFETACSQARHRRRRRGASRRMCEDLSGAWLAVPIRTGAGGDSSLASGRAKEGNKKGDRCVRECQGVKWFFGERCAGGQDVLQRDARSEGVRGVRHVVAVHRWRAEHSGSPQTRP